MKPRALILSVLAGLVLVSAANAQPVAEQLDDGNIDRRPGGIDAIGGKGDWLLSNGVLCAVVSDVPHEIGLSMTGGWLIDLGHCGRDDDQLNYTHQLPGMEKTWIIPAQSIRTESGEGFAAVIVERAGPSLTSTMRYEMRDESPRRLTMVRELKRIGPGPRITMVGQIWLHPHRSLAPFGIATRHPEHSPGYQFPAFDRNDTSTMLNAMLPVDLTVLVGAEGVGPGISYGVLSQTAVLIDSDGDEESLLQFSLTESDYSNQGWLSEGLWVDSGGIAGGLGMLQSLVMDIDVGEVLRIQQQLIVGDRADVAAVTDQVYQGAWVRGTVHGDSARILVRDMAGNPLTEILADGAFAVRLPAGVNEALLEVRTLAGSVRQIPLHVDGDELTLRPIELATTGRLALASRQPMRLVLKGLGETPDPVIADDLINFSVGDKGMAASASSNVVSLVGDASDPQLLELPPGNYRVYASRGIEYSVQHRDIVIEKGAETRLAPFELVRQLDSDGLLSVDFHVHSGYSFDSAISPEQRLRSFIAQGADVLIATEHDNLVDMAQLARANNWQQKLHVISGAEITGMAPSPTVPRTIGHLNVYPLVPDPQAFSGGMPLHENKLLRDVLGELRALDSSPLIQMNHPRDVDMPDADISFFEHRGAGRAFNPALPLTDATNAQLLKPNRAGLRDIDFDVLEIFNGASLALYQRVRADWVAMMLQGEYRAAVASSDSHHLRAPVAMPRSYVVASDSDGLDRQALFEAVRAGRVQGSTGPMLQLALRNEQGQLATIGDTLVGDRGVLSVSVASADWVDVDTLLVYVNGQVETHAIKAGDTLELPLEFSGDSFVFVEVYGPPGEIYRALAPGYIPMAYSNPIWVDADGNGQWQAPGLLPAPAVVTEPHSLPALPEASSTAANQAAEG